MVYTLRVNLSQLIELVCAMDDRINETGKQIAGIKRRKTAEDDGELFVGETDWLESKQKIQGELVDILNDASDHPEYDDTDMDKPFAKVQWIEEDLRNALELAEIKATDDNVDRLLGAIDEDELTCSMISAGWDYIYRVRDEEFKEELK